MEMKKICFYLLMVFVFSAIAQPIAAAPANVLDCLENNQGCEEELNEAPGGQERGEETAGESPAGGFLLFDLVKMFFALLLVLALIFLLLKFLNKRNKLFQQVKGLENLGGVSVGQNKSVQIIRIGTKFYMIGVGENVEMLGEVTDEQTVEELLHRNREEADQTTAGQLLPAFLKQKQSENGKTPGQFKKLFASELDSLKQTRKAIINQRGQKEDQHE